MRDEQGGLIREKRFESSRKQRLYTSGKVFSVIDTNHLWVWVPASYQLLVLDHELNGIVRDIPMSEEMASFNGQAMEPILQAGSNQKAIQEYAEANRNVLIRLVPERLFLYKGSPTLSYHLLRLEGYSKEYQSEVMLSSNQLIVMRKDSTEKIMVSDAGQPYSNVVKGLLGEQLLLQYQQGRRLRYKTVTP